MGDRGRSGSGGEEVDGRLDADERFGEIIVRGAERFCLFFSGNERHSPITKLQQKSSKEPFIVSSCFLSATNTFYHTSRSRTRLELKGDECHNCDRLLWLRPAAEGTEAELAAATAATDSRYREVLGCKFY